MNEDHLTLGIAFGCPHGTAGVVARNGRIVSGIALERILGVKYAWIVNPDHVDDTIRHYASMTPQKVPLAIEEHLPRLIDYLLDAAGATFEEIDLVAYDRYSIATGPFRVEDEGSNPYLDDLFHGKTVVRVPHHAGHQAQAFYPSPFEEAAILTIDGGSYAALEHLGGTPQNSSIAHGRGKEIEVRLENIGLGISGKEYLRATMHIGFHLNEEGKTMGLAPYGSPALHDRIRPKLAQRLSPFRPTGGRHGHDYSPDNFGKLSRRVRDSHQGQYMSPPCRDLAWAVQQRIEDRVIRAARIAHELTGSKNLTYAGGVALNSVANRKILQETPIEQIFVYPNAGDCGLAAGYALWAYHRTTDGPNDYVARHDYLGKRYSDEEIEAAIERVGDRITAERHPISRTAEPVEGTPIEEIAAERIENGQIIGWFQGGAEFGPRALGHRSIICDCRRPEHKDILNARVKHREPYRPFAPVVLAERLSEFFDLPVECPFMLLVPQVVPEKREVIPSVTHVDGTARVQSVTAEDNGIFYRLVEAFGRRTGVPVILNTSFNIAGKPIVETPDDALECFLSTDIDALVLEGWVVEKKSETR